MDPTELIAASRLLASGQPTQEALRRAVSTAYYAMFHTLSASNADLIEGPRTQANQATWTATYRSLRHTRAGSMVQRWPHLFTPAIRNFAVIIDSMKRQREDADFNPDASFTQQQVVTRIANAEQAIADFNSAPAQERALAAIATLAGQR